MSDISFSEKWLFPSQYCGIREKFVEEGKMVERRVALLLYHGRLLPRAVICHEIAPKSGIEQEIFRGQSVTEKNQFFIAGRVMMGLKSGNQDYGA